MHQVKATNSLTLRKIIQKRGAQLEKQFLQLLSKETLILYECAFASSWISAGVEKEFMETGAKLLFPDSKRPVFELGRLLAQHTFSGIYKVFFRIQSISATVKRAGLLWQRFNGLGTMSASLISRNHAVAIVTEAQELLPHQLALVSGYLQVGLEFSGAKNVAIECDFSDPAHFKWHIRWE